jgi:hypothetical protein
MDVHRIDASSVRGHTKDKNPSKSSGGRSKPTGRSKSPVKYLRKCWKCGKIGNYNKYCNSMDLIVPLPQRKKPPLNKEVMFTWHIQVHM